MLVLRFEKSVFMTKISTRLSAVVEMIWLPIIDRKKIDQKLKKNH